MLSFPWGSFVHLQAQPLYLLEYSSHLSRSVIWHTSLAFTRGIPFLPSNPRTLFFQAAGLRYRVPAKLKEFTQHGGAPKAETWPLCHSASLPPKNLSLPGKSSRSLECLHLEGQEPVENELINELPGNVRSSEVRIIKIMCVIFYNPGHLDISAQIKCQRRADPNVNHFVSQL